LVSYDPKTKFITLLFNNLNLSSVPVEKLEEVNISDEWATAVKNTVALLPKIVKEKLKL